MVPPMTDAEREQMDLLRGWLSQTSAPWKQHSIRMVQQV